MRQSTWIRASTAGVGLLLALVSHAYVISERSPGKPYFLDSPNAVTFVVHSGTRAGQANLNGEEVITTASAPTAAILSAMNRWSSITDSLLQFSTPTLVESASHSVNSQNLITFADTPSNRSVVFGAVAVTQVISDLDGMLVDTDIIFNPSFPFSTTLEDGTFDIEGTLVHELGHALGLSHSGSVSSTMFASTARASADLRTLADDDSAFARATYPAPGIPAGGTLIVDTQFSTGSTARGILVTAIDQSSNTLFSTHSDNNGRAVFAGMPAGTYTLYTEPANGPAHPGQFSQFGIRAAIGTAISGGPNAPQPFVVQAFFESFATLTVNGGPDIFNIEGAGGAEPGAMITSDFGLIVNPGKDYFVELYGAGLDDPALSLSSISFIGTGVSTSGPFERSEITLSDDTVRPLVRFNISIAEDAPIGSASVLLRLGDELSIFTGFLEVENPTPLPIFSSAGITSAASFAAGTISPGEIISIFGENLGPTDAAPAFFDPLSSGLSEQLDGISVLIDSRPAPLFFASPGQLNVQAPFELQTGSVVAVRVLRDDVSSAEVFVLVGPTSPGLFTIPDSPRAVALNEDGSINSLSKPADRGSILVLYATGLGGIAPTLPTGQPAPLSQLHHATADVVVTIGGQDAVVHFAGLAPGFVGLMQINVEVPANSPVGDTVAVRLLASGIASQQGTTVSIR